MAAEQEYGIELVIKTEQAEANVKRTTGALTDLNSALELVKKGANLLAEALKFPVTQFSALIDKSIELVRAYDEDARAQERLIITLRNQGDASGEAAKKLIEQAAALQKVTRFSDDSIIAGQNLAAQTLGASIDMERFTKVAVDLAAALDGDVGAAFQKLTQGVQSGSIRGYVQGISDASSASQRMEEVLSFLESRIGGTAERLGQIGAGPLDQLNNAFSDFEEELGKIITKTPEWQAFVQTATEFFEAVKDFAASNPEAFTSLFGQIFATSFNLAAASVRVFIDVLGVAGQAISSIFETLDNLSALPGFTSPFKNVEDQIAKLRQERAQLLDLANQESFHGTPSSSPETEQRLRDTATKVLDLTEQINKMEQGLERLKSGNLFQPIGESLKGIGEEIEGLKKQAEESENPLLTFDGVMQRYAENTAKAREENKKNAEAMKESAEAAEKLSTALQNVPTKEESASVRRRQVDVQDTYQQIFGPQQDAEKRLEDINTLLANNGDLVDENSDKVQRLRESYDQFLIASLEGNTDFGAGVERTFAKFRLEATDSAAVAEKALGTMADFGTDAIVDLVNNGGAGFKELARGAVVEIEKVIARMLVLQLLGVLFPGAGPAVGVAAGAAGGGIAGSAAGGNDVQKGRSFLVGERGVEKFTPRENGRVDPLTTEKPKLNIQVVNVSNLDDVKNAINGGEWDDVIMNVHARNPSRARNF